MTPWAVLLGNVPRLAEKLKVMRPPKLRVLVDGRVAYWALAVPLEEDLEAHGDWPGQSAPSLEAWLRERLLFLAETWPEAQGVELLGLWAGDPPRLERLARVRVREVAGAGG